MSKLSRSSKQGNPEKLSQIRVWRYAEQMQCGNLDWMLEQKKNISRKTGGI